MQVVARMIALSFAAWTTNQAGKNIALTDAVSAARHRAKGDNFATARMIVEDTSEMAIAALPVAAPVWHPNPKEDPRFSMNLISILTARLAGDLRCVWSKCHGEGHG